MDKDHISAAQKLVSILARKAACIWVNGFPTGKEVCDNMACGWPYSINQLW
jgi:hypothetical protein